MRRMSMLFLAVLLGLTACGGAPTDGGDDQDNEPATTQSADGGGDTTPPPTSTEAGGGDDDNAAGEGPSTGTVTIGDDTYMFSSEGATVAQCLTDLFGIFAAQIPMVDSSGAPADGFLGIVALHEDTDPAEVEQISSVHVSIGDADWVADPEDVRWNGDPETAAMSFVESVQVDGSTVTGTASFVGRADTTQELMTLPGTFEATCGEERTS